MQKLTRMDVEALQQEMPILDEIAQRSVCGGSGEMNPVSREVYISMLGSGSWRGGFVEGMGYVSAEVVAMPGNYYESVGGYISSLRTSGVDYACGEIISSIPGVGALYGVTDARLLNGNLTAASACVNSGYTGPIFVQTETDQSYGIIIKVFNATTGELITRVNGEF